MVLKQIGVLLIRRTISVALIFALVANQLAGAMPHAHGGMSAEEQAAHDAVPHVHFGRHSHAHHHCHFHSHGNHRPGVHHHHQHHGAHHHRHPQQQSPRECEDFQSPCEHNWNSDSGSCPYSDHDHDAIYICDEFATVSNWSQMESLCLTTDFQWPPEFFAWQGAPPRQIDWLVFERPPDKVIDGSTIYLTTLSLRL